MLISETPCISVVIYIENFFLIKALGAFLRSRASDKNLRGLSGFDEDYVDEFEVFFATSTNREMAECRGVR